MRASAGSQSSSVDLRYTLEGSHTLGFMAIGVIVLAFAALAGGVLEVRPAVTGDAPDRDRALRAVARGRHGDRHQTG